MTDLIAPLAVLPLTYGATVVAEALDPTTFATVSGVVVGPFTITAYDTGGSTGLQTIPIPGLVPAG